MSTDHGHGHAYGPWTWPCLRTMAMAMPRDPRPSPKLCRREKERDWLTSTFLLAKPCYLHEPLAHIGPDLRQTGQCSWTLPKLQKHSSKSYALRTEMYPKKFIETYLIQIKAIQWKSVNIRAKSKVSKNITESLRMTGNAHTSHEIYRNL